MSALYEKIASLPPSLLPMVEKFVDSLPTINDGQDAWMIYTESAPHSVVDETESQNNEKPAA